MTTTLGPAPHLAHHLVDLKNRRRDTVLGELAREAVRCGAACEPESLTATLLMRERLGSTAAGHGIAIPSARSLLVTRPITLLGRSRRGIEWEAAADGPVSTVLLVLSPGSVRAAAHVASVARAAAATRLARGRQRLAGCPGPTELATLLAGGQG
jgi:mannitol/fructose-specific phosphotransferase system IIA component (Ntr-type)